MELVSVFSIHVEIVLTKGICKSQATLRIKFVFPRQCCLFFNRIPTSVFWKISVIECVSFILVWKKHLRHMYGKWWNSENVECPYRGHQRAGREHLIIIASNDYSSLFDKLCYRGERDFYFLTENFDPMCPEASLYTLFVPRISKFCYKQSYV